MGKYHQSVVERYRKLILKLDEYNDANNTSYDTIESREINADLNYNQTYTYMGNAKRISRTKFEFTAFVLLVETPNYPYLYPGHIPGVEEVRREPYIKIETALEDEVIDNIRMYQKAGNYGSKIIHWVTKIELGRIDQKPIQLKLM